MLLSVAVGVATRLSVKSARVGRIRHRCQQVFSRRLESWSGRNAQRSHMVINALTKTIGRTFRVKDYHDSVSNSARPNSLFECFVSSSAQNHWQR